VGLKDEYMLLVPLAFEFSIFITVPSLKTPNQALFLFFFFFLYTSNRFSLLFPLALQIYFEPATAVLKVNDGDNYQRQ